MRKKDGGIDQTSIEDIEIFNQRQLTKHKRLPGADIIRELIKDIEKQFFCAIGRLGSRSYLTLIGAIVHTFFTSTVPGALQRLLGDEEEKQLQRDV